MSYAIICDARVGRAYGISVLALVDRDKTRDFWWTSDRASLILNYRSKSAADYARNRFRHNNAMVVDYVHAVDVIKRQAEISSQREEYLMQKEQYLMEENAMASVEGGWDGHKAWT